MPFTILDSKILQCQLTHFVLTLYSLCTTLTMYRAASVCCISNTSSFVVHCVFRFSALQLECNLTGSRVSIVPNSFTVTYDDIYAAYRDEHHRLPTDIRWRAKMTVKSFCHWRVNAVNTIFDWLHWLYAGLCSGAAAASWRRSGSLSHGPAYMLTRQIIYPERPPSPVAISIVYFNIFIYWTDQPMYQTIFKKASCSGHMNKTQF